MIGDIPKLARLSTIDMVRGRAGGGVGDANGFGGLLATGRFGMVVYENRNLRGSFQVEKIFSFREVRGVDATPCSCELPSFRLHSSFVADSVYSTSQSLVSQ